MSRRFFATLFGAFLWMALMVSVNADPPVATSEVAAGPRAVLRWKARSEKGIYGYLVYRANVENGRYRRVNPEIIHVGPGKLDEPSEYRFVDRDVEAGRTYFYYLDTIGDNGTKARFSNVISKTVTER